MNDLDVFNSNMDKPKEVEQVVQQNTKQDDKNDKVIEAMQWQQVANQLALKQSKVAVDTASYTILERHKFKTMLDNEELWYYKNGYYKPIGEAIIKDIIQKQEPVKDFLSTHFISEVINSVKRKTYIDRKDFEAPLNIICVKNGCYNILTKVLEPHTHNYYFKNQIPINFNECANCPNIDSFISSTIEPKFQKASYEIVAFTLYRHYFIQKAIMLTGVGQNGKSVYLDILSKFLGDENVSHEQLQGICHSSFSSAELYGKLANICGDLPAVILEDTGNFKQLTSGMDSISAQKKFMNPFNFVNHAKLLFSANEIPETKDQTEAFFRRWLIIDFPYKFVSGLKEEEYVGFIKKEDKNLIQKLITEQELEGLLNKSITILHELIATRQFTNSPTTSEIKMKYNLKSNSAVVFMELFIDDEVEEENDYVQKEHLYQQYVEYCEYKGVHFKKAESFFKSMKDRWNPNTEKRTVSLGVRKNCFIGIRYKYWREAEGLDP